MIEAGLDWLDVGILPKGDPRKVQIAKVRTKTCVPLSFVGRELSMGTPMNVSELTDRKKHAQAPRSPGTPEFQRRRPPSALFPTSSFFLLRFAFAPASVLPCFPLRASHFDFSLFTFHFPL